MSLHYANSGFSRHTSCSWTNPRTAGGSDSILTRFASLFAFLVEFSSLHVVFGLFLAFTFSWCVRDCVAACRVFKKSVNQSLKQALPFFQDTAHKTEMNSWKSQRWLGKKTMHAYTTRYTAASLENENNIKLHPVFVTRLQGYQYRSFSNWEMIHHSYYA